MLRHTITHRYIYNLIRIPTLCTDACELNTHAFRFLMSLMKDSAHARERVLRECVFVLVCANVCLYLFARMCVCISLREFFMMYVWR